MAQEDIEYIDRLKQVYGKKRPWYAITIAGGSHMHSFESADSAPVFTAQSIASKVSMKADPWEHIMPIGFVHKYTDNWGGHDKGWAVVAFVKFVWDTREVTDVKFMNITADDYHAIVKDARQAKDNHEPLKGDKVQQVYSELDDMILKRMNDQNKKDGSSTVYAYKGKRKSK